jgi:hypothetical protein
MPITDIIILSVIVFAFLAFAVVLAWGDHQTREIARLRRERALFGSDAHVVLLKQCVEAENAIADPHAPPDRPSRGRSSGLLIRRNPLKSD